MSDRYIFRYIIILVAIVSVLLSAAAMWLQPYQHRNQENEKRVSILKAAGITEVNSDNVEQLFKQHCTSVVGGELPMYTIDNQITVIPMKGNGLWGPIWGYIGIAADGKTVTGAVFDHKSETPGLGAEITTDYYQSQYKGKQLQLNNNNVSLEVDAITGATRTSVGIEKMIDQTLKLYLPYLEGNE
ncbi:MAG: FMN-binding protein [Bacteroidales bacterium]|nr:FMN-binding protein [Bacteroidales bacterium]